MRLALLLCLLATPAPAQDLLPQPDLAPDVAATPRLPEATPAAASINARLAALDAEALAFQGECVTGPDSDYSRWVEVPLSSDTFVTLLVFEAVLCAGAAHPGSVLLPLTFNRLTGNEVAPLSWLPASLAPADPQNLSDLASLTELYIASERETASYPPDPECYDLLRHQHHGFDLWPDAAAPGLVLMPTGLAYVDTPCANPVTLPLATLTPRATACRRAQGQSPPLHFGPNTPFPLHPRRNAAMTQSPIRPPQPLQLGPNTHLSSPTPGPVQTHSLPIG